VVSQQFSEPFELLIGEDCSTDDTRAVCADLRKQYPDVVRVIEHATNVGMHENFAALWGEARGEYIAMCEGDDYWVDPQKLSKQMDFLRANSDCTFCAALTRKVELGADNDWLPAGEISPTVVKEKYSFGELISAYNFHFSSIMLRKDAVSFPTWFDTVYCVDRPLYLLAAMHGKAGLIPEVMSVYRLHSGGNWSVLSMQSKAQRSTDLFLKMRDYFDPRYRNQFQHTLGAILWSYMAADLNAGSMRSARCIFWRSLRYSSVRMLLTEPLRYVKVMLRLYSPVWLYRFYASRHA
jgi:glycosyltransferase involved in cell wall biosynthesis